MGRDVCVLYWLFNCWINHNSNIHYIECIRNTYDLYWHCQHTEYLMVWLKSPESQLSKTFSRLKIGWIVTKLDRDVCVFCRLCLNIALNVLEIPMTCVDSVNIHSIECITCFDPLYQQCQHTQHRMHFRLWSSVSMSQCLLGSACLKDQENYDWTTAELISELFIKVKVKVQTVCRNSVQRCRWYTKKTLIRCTSFHCSGMPVESHI